MFVCEVCYVPFLCLHAGVALCVIALSVCVLWECECPFVCACVWFACVLCLVVCVAICAVCVLVFVCGVLCLCFEFVCLFVDAFVCNCECVVVV